MSKLWRIAVVVEGPTDSIVLEAIVRSLLAGAEFELQTLQPEGSVAFGPHGPGWGGVYRWSDQVTKKLGGLRSDSSVLDQWDLLIIHLDADVAGNTYASAKIKSPPRNDLPCEKPCPLPHDTTNALRTVLLGWLDEQTCPPRTILCTPSKTMDAWTLTAILPEEATFQQKAWKCRPNPEKQLNALPQEKRFSKRKRDYLERSEEISQAWPRVSTTLTEAKQFEEDFLHAIHGRHKQSDNLPQG